MKWNKEELPYTPYEKRSKTSTLPMSIRLAMAPRFDQKMGQAMKEKANASHSRASARIGLAKKVLKAIEKEGLIHFERTYKPFYTGLWRHLVYMPIEGVHRRIVQNKLNSSYKYDGDKSTVIQWTDGYRPLTDKEAIEFIKKYRLAE